MSVSTAGPRTYGFLLLPDFALLTYASAIEPLRAANALSGRDLYRWRHISPDGQPVRASNGVAIAVDEKVGDTLDLDAVVAVAGGNPARFRHKPTFTFLRRLAARGVMLAGVSGGPYALARAGVLEGHRCTVHWEHVPAFTEEFPDLDVRRTLYEIDRDRVTCAGGIATLDMMTDLIARDHGPVLANAVSEWFLRTHARPASGAQRMAPRERFGIGNAKVLAVLAEMEKRLEEPASREELARGAGISVRQLERLFADHVGESVGGHYLSLRLDRARSLLRQTALPVAEVAMATGFVSTSHFSRAYKARFGLSPTGERGSRAGGA
ncbi:HTH-type transcriptional regulator CdhR [Azorhizobium oxalatiphilum]|uniref:HTH-type transcriptional regulator CdhR n=1 Tax=Azorhizobium oxalatiphilum TaxID=980631 RepID=A0A917C6Z0_9HYPH|nr:HTH-type transcriptional regulator CdhR [Azorhizobium oxalatiphilum]